jgi:hypothetical protein
MADHHQSELVAPCSCFSAPLQSLASQRVLGMDANFAEISILVCPLCGQHWLRYYYELEAFTASGRWYLGAISADLAARLTADEGKAILEELPWYFYGGSYFGGKTGRSADGFSLFP